METVMFQELQMEKQKNGRVEAMMREQRAAMEKELSVIQAKSQTSYQELNNYQIKVKLGTHFTTMSKAINC